MSSSFLNIFIQMLPTAQMLWRASLFTMNLFDVDKIWFWYDSETVRVVFWVGFHVGLRLLEPLIW